MASNSILPFGATASNELSQSAYAADAQRLTGNQPGVARSPLVNKALHQLSVVAAGVAQFVADRQSADVVDTLTPAQFATMLAAAGRGGLIGVQRLASSGTYVRSAGAVSGIVIGIGGGGGGGNSSNTGAANVSVGYGGGSGSSFEHYFAALPATQAYTIGAGGAGVGAAGGATAFGSLNAPGGLGGNSTNAAPPFLVTGGVDGGLATGGNIMVTQGQQGGGGQALNTSAFVSGAGAPSRFGGGGRSLGTVTSGGFSAGSPGAGGGGAITGTSSAGQTGGSGGAGLILVYEFGGQ